MRRRDGSGRRTGDDDFRDVAAGRFGEIHLLEAFRGDGQVSHRNIPATFQQGYEFITGHGYEHDMDAG